MEKYLLDKRKKDDPVMSTENESAKKSKVSNSSSNTPSRNLVIKWCSLYKWLQVEWQNNVPFFKCGMCISAKKSNNLSNDATGHLISKVDVLKKHESSVEHKQAVQSTCMKESNIWEKSVAKSVSKAEESVTSAMKIVYLQAKENLATRKFSSIKDLCIDLGCTSLAGLNVGTASYESYDSIRDMEMAIAMTVQDKLIDKINTARLFSIIIDECTDVSIDQSLIIYFKVLHQGKLFTHYLRLVEMEGASANHIYSCVIKTLEKMNIDVSKCSSLGTDGPSVMTGIRGGVAALFKNLNPYLISVHCVAHRLALAVKQAASENAYLVKYQDILKRIHSYFECSPGNTRCLKNAQDNLEQTSKKFIKLSTTRWLSLGNSIAALDCNWHALVLVLTDDERCVAKGLLKKITSYLFLATTAVMNDIMFSVNKLCLMFQKSNLDFECVKLGVDVCLKNLEELKNGTGTHLMSFADAVPQNASDAFEFQGHIISDSPKQREMFSNLMKRLLNSIIDNIKDRLGDLDKIEMFSIFLPSNMPQNSTDLQQYGQTEIKCLFNLLSSNPLLNGLTEIDMLSEWALFKHILQQRCKTMSFQELLEFLHANDMSEHYPLMTFLIEYCATLPMHTVDCERGFSCLNLMKNDIRNRLTINNVSNILMINIEGPERSRFNFHEAFVKWANMKERKIVNPKPKCFE